MKAIGALGATALCVGVLTSTVAQAQDRTGLGTQIDGLAVFQGDADLSGGGDFTANRTFLRAGSTYTFGNGHSFGLSASIGRFDYDFSEAANQPWTDINDLRVSLPTRLRLSERTTAFIAPQVRWDYQSGVDASDGRTYGIFAGISWRLSDSLTIGPAFGAYSQLEESGAEVFPALLVNWNITDRLNLNTGSGLGATGGPGLTLRYAVSDDVGMSLSARSERVRFRLDDEGLAPGGVGEDSSIPVVVAVDYSPNPGMSISVFAGAEFDGELRLDDASGRRISRQSYDTAPLAGLAFRLRF